MKFKEAPNSASVNLLERLASWSYTIVEEIISLRMRWLSEKSILIPSCFVLRGRETGTEICSAHEVFLHQVEGTPCSRKRVKNPSVVCVLHVTNRCFRCLFILDSHAESRFCKNAIWWSLLLKLKCHLSVITVGRKRRKR